MRFEETEFSSHVTRTEITPELSYHNLLCFQTPDLDPLGSEQSLEDVESINEFEPLFAEEQPEVEKPVAAVQVWFLSLHLVPGVCIPAVQPVC